MTLLAEPSASTTRISTDLEKLWRGQFLAEQGQTPIGIVPTESKPENNINITDMTATVRFAGGVYDPAIIRFYEDIILELQKQVVKYRELWEAATRAAQQNEPDDVYFPRQTVPLSQKMAEKLRRSTRPGLRVSGE
jgi:hypothetical protein